MKFVQTRGGQYPKFVNISAILWAEWVDEGPARSPYLQVQTIAGVYERFTNDAEQIWTAIKESAAGK